MALSFQNRVVIITGAGGGLGRQYALDFAKRGARVVVNDLGGSFKGEGMGSKRSADLVVDEIIKLGGEAIASYDSVLDAPKIVDLAIQKWGRVDVLVNNAGILRDVTFAKMNERDWNLLYDVHVKGAFLATKSVWPYFRQQKYGRVVFVSSGAGLYGNFGQSNYAAMKMALVGFAQSLAKEGQTKNLYSNVVAPIAGTRLTETVLPKDMVEALKPDYVSPLVLYLSHESSKENGSIFELGGGWISKLRWNRTNGAFFKPNDFSPESVRDRFEEICDFSNGGTFPTTLNDAFTPIMTNLQGQSGSIRQVKFGLQDKNKKETSSVEAPSQELTIDSLLSFKFAPIKYSYNERDLISYALSVGASLNEEAQSLEKNLKAQEKDPDFQYTCEFASNFQALPTFGVDVLAQLSSIPQLASHLNLSNLLHAEHSLDIKCNPIPLKCSVIAEAKIVGIENKSSSKGAAVLLHLHVFSRNEKDGMELFVNRFTLFIRGSLPSSFFSSSSSSASSFAVEKKATVETPDRAPDFVQFDKTLSTQALNYRISSGDLNPIHVLDSDFFSRPILHGLCTFGFAARAILKHCGGEHSVMKSISAKFIKIVYPGEVLITEMWRVDTHTVSFRVKVPDRAEYVLANGVAILNSFSSMEKEKEEEKKKHKREEAIVKQASPPQTQTLRPQTVSKNDASSSAINSWSSSSLFPSSSSNSSYYSSPSSSSPYYCPSTTSLLSNDASNVRPSPAKRETSDETSNQQKNEKDDSESKLLKTEQSQQSSASQQQTTDKNQERQQQPRKVPSQWKSTAFFMQLKEQMSDADFSRQLQKVVGATYRFDIQKDSDGEVISWMVDLKNTMGAVSLLSVDPPVLGSDDPTEEFLAQLKSRTVEQKAYEPDCIVSMKEKHFLQLMNGTLDAQTAFLEGDLQIKGNLLLAQKLSHLSKLHLQSKL